LRCIPVLAISSSRIFVFVSFEALT
jgi:hypothetical protein